MRPLFLFPLIFIWIHIQFIDPDRCIFLDIQTFPAVIADLVRVKVAHFTFKTPVAFLLFIQNAHFLFHNNSCAARSGGSRHVFFDPL